MTFKALRDFFSKRKSHQKNNSQQKIKPKPTSPNGHWTNQVLVHVNPAKRHTYYYLPLYAKFKVKNIEEMAFESLRGKVSGVMIIDIFYGNIPEKIV